MWIAKPLGALTSRERMAWIETQDPDRPLSQNLAWAEAAQSILDKKVLVIFSPEERVGGILLANDDDLECVNGPILSWPTSEASRQIATFAMAAARANPAFRSIILRPRWVDRGSDKNEFTEILKALPIQPKSLNRAETLYLKIEHSSDRQRAGFTPRLRRTLKNSLDAGTRARRLDLNPETLGRFARSIKSAASKKGFFVPDEKWFHFLVFGEPGSIREKIRFFLIEGNYRDQALTQILCCVNGKTAHYLFGFDERADGIPSSISTSATAHDLALAEAFRDGAETYDLNGFIDPNEQHPYAGVARFKAQFGGTVVRYLSPEFEIQNG